MKKAILILSISFSAQLGFSQESIDTASTNRISNANDSRIDAMEETYISTYKLKGFRVQIHQGHKRQPANQIRASFLRVHPKTKAHLDYSQPFYKVRVGDFKSKLEALKYKNFIIDEYPNSFIVKDDIDISELEQ